MSVDKNIYFSNSKTIPHINNDSEGEISKRNPFPVS